MKPLSWYKDLHTQKGRAENNAFLVEGVRAISQILAVCPESVVEVLSAEKDNAVSQILLACEVRRLTDAQFGNICLSKHPAGPLAVVVLPAGVQDSSLPADCGDSILVCEDVQDPGNIGTLIRTAAAFDFSGVIMSDKCADPFAPKAVQSSAGTVLSLWLRRTSDYRICIKNLIRQGFACVAADIRGTQTFAAVAEKKIMLVLGNEGIGLTKETLKLATHLVRIPMNSTKAESLNVAVSGAIGMYEMRKK